MALRIFFKMPLFQIDNNIVKWLKDWFKKIFQDTLRMTKVFSLYLEREFL